MIIGILRTVRRRLPCSWVDDDPLLRAAVQRDTSGRGHLVRTADAALPALQDLATNPPDLVILDLGLPDLDGRRVLHLVRSLHPDLPGVIAPARNEDAEIARVTAVLRRARREFDLLAYLAARPDRVVSHRELLTEVWKNTHGQRQLLDVQLSTLRRKLDETAENPRYLHRVRGVDVRLSAPVPA
jgi:DNA-binding response OmpR family regulator